MQFELTKTKALLVNVNPRAELHGEDKKPAGDLKLLVDLANDDLAMFSPSLKSLLYHWDAQMGGDLVDVAKRDEDKHYAPHLRMPKLAPLKWEDEIIGASVTVHHGVKSDIKLELCSVNEFRIEPKQGGTVSLGFRVQAHPDEKAFGKLCSLIGTDVDITVIPPAADETGDDTEK